MKMMAIIAMVTASAMMCGCNGNAKSQSGSNDSDSTAKNVVFNADSAYNFVSAQCNFGPRVPGTPAHSSCEKYLVKTLNAYCDSVIVQNASVKTFDGKDLAISNIIGQINPDAQQRLLLLAHWDCRPWADNDPDKSKRQQPVMGANDAASGVGVLLELARIMAKNKPNIGVDILLVDAEDWGKTDDDNSWGLGTQYWAKHQHVINYKPIFGILLDMVGASGAQFGREYFSEQYGGGFVDEVWRLANGAGYSSYFKDVNGGAVTDDHVFVNRAGIPCIDIIDMRTNGNDSGFFDGWHTTHDTMDVIDRNTLKAVGQTVANLIYEY
jgi:hypothetical protein